VGVARRDLLDQLDGVPHELDAVADVALGVVFGRVKLGDLDAHRLVEVERPLHVGGYDSDCAHFHHNEETLENCR
jgi:hypothetical protein